MPKFGLGVSKTQLNGKLTIYARVPSDLYALVRVDMARSGMSVKQQSDWFCQAVNFLHTLAVGDNEGFFAGYKMLSGGTGKARQIYLSEPAASNFLEMEKMLLDVLGSGAKVRTRLLMLAASSYLLSQ